MSGFLLQAFIYLVAAVVAVPLAKRLGMGSVLGYLLAGAFIGPVTGLIGSSETKDLQHFAEFGVVMMLFIVGLELEPRKLWAMRVRLLGLGGLQVLITAVLIGSGLYWLGWTLRESIAIGMIMSLSSTAIVLQTLSEKNLLKSEGGSASFSILLFQDIAVIPMFAAIPLLAEPGYVWMSLDQLKEAASHTDKIHMGLVDGLPAWGVASVTIGAVLAVVVAGHYLSHPLFHVIAQTRLREMFTATALLVVIGIALLMTLVGLSPALGTFLAGVVLANSDFRHELEADIEPFKGLLLGLFFITVGASIDFDIFMNEPVLVIGLALGIMAIKLFVLFVLAYGFGIRPPHTWLVTLSLAQAGEFGFVLLTFSLQNQVLSNETVRLLLMVVTLTMLLTPAMFIVYERFITRFRFARVEPTADEITEKGPVIIAGLGRFGQIINRMMVSNGFSTVVLDHRAELIQGLKKFGIKSFYGDPSRIDLLRAAGLHDATLLVVAIDDEEKSVEIVRQAKRENPDIHVVARAHDRMHVYQLYRAGADDIVRETFDSSVRASRYALMAMGFSEYRAQELADVFVEHDVETVRHLARLWKEDMSVFENEEYISAARERDRLMQDAMERMREKREAEKRRKAEEPDEDEEAEDDAEGKTSDEESMPGEKAPVANDNKAGSVAVDEAEPDSESPGEVRDKA